MTVGWLEQGREGGIVGWLVSWLVGGYKWFVSFYIMLWGRVCMIVLRKEALVGYGTMVIHLLGSKWMDGGV